MVSQKVWLSMRHFLTDEYRNDIYMGQQQYPICNTDIRTNGYLDTLRSCLIFASPLKRSQQTVEYVVETYPQIDFKVIYLDGLKERGLGDFEGKHKELIRHDEEYFINKKFIVTKTPPNGESFNNFKNRVNHATKIMLEESKSSNILVVSHLQTLRMIKFCILETDNYEIWHNINYTHGEIIKEDYGEK